MLTKVKGSVWNPEDNKLYLKLSAKEFSITGDGTTDDTNGFNELIAHINSVGNVSRSLYQGVDIHIPAGIYNLKAGSLDPILVSNVSIYCDKGAVFKVRDGHVWTIGDASTIPENFLVTGGYCVTDPADVLSFGSAWVYGVNCARVFIRDFNCYRLPHIFKAVAVASGTISSIYINTVQGLGHPSYNWIDINTDNAVAAAGLFITQLYGYPYVPPANPQLLPETVTGATQTNPVQITHTKSKTTAPFSTGDKVVIANVGGMTELNGNTYTITVIDDTHFTLDGVDGTAYTAYTTGGKVAELHWSVDYQTAVIRIVGKWDTAMLSDSLLQHYAWLWKITCTTSSSSPATVSYIYTDNVIFDYVGYGMHWLYPLEGSVTEVSTSNCWHSGMNGRFLEIVGGGAGFISEYKVVNVVIGMLGSDFINASVSTLVDLIVDNVVIEALGRVRNGTSYFINCQSTTVKANISNCKILPPASKYGGAADTHLIPAIGIALNSAIRFRVVNNEMFALTTNYQIGRATSGGGIRSIRGNICRSGARPEYEETFATSMPASGDTITNHTGLIMTVNLRGGAITNVSKNGTVILSGIAAYSFDVNPGETWMCNYTSAPALVYSYRD